MGSSRYDASLYSSYARSTNHMSAASYHAKTPDMHAFVTSGAAKKYVAKEIKIRESRKSDLNPNPTPVIVALDVSGSMGRVVEAMRKGLGTLFEQILDRNPVSDPHVLAMAVGDMDYDSAPVQATQFEADPVTIGKQIEDLYLERGGGGNDHESYLGPWYFAWQGPLRLAPLMIERIAQEVNGDLERAKCAVNLSPRTIVTCLDQVQFSPQRMSVVGQIIDSLPPIEYVAWGPNHRQSFRERLDNVA